MDDGGLCSGTLGTAATATICSTEPKNFIIHKAMGKEWTRNRQQKTYKRRDARGT